MSAAADPTSGAVGEPVEVLAARARAARGLRDLGHALVGHHAPASALERVAAQLEELTTELAWGPRRGRDPATFGSSTEGPPVDGEVMTSFCDRPISGSCSPWGVDLEVRRQGHEAVGRVVLRAAHEGAPGRSHGGVVAAIFDDLMGFVLQIHRVAAFTGELTVRYEAPVPLFVPLTFRARLREHSGRKLLIDAECTDGETVLARSAAVFIAVATLA